MAGASPGVSLPDTSPFTIGVFSSVTKVSSPAVGSRSTGSSPTETVTVAGLLSSPSSSRTVYWNTMSPFENPSLGVTSNVPSGSSVTVPFATCAVLGVVGLPTCEVIGSPFTVATTSLASSPSGSLSLSSASTMTGTPGSVVPVSLTAIGGSSGASPTVIVTVAVSSPPLPSEIV